MDERTSKIYQAILTSLIYGLIDDLGSGVHLCGVEHHEKFVLEFFTFLTFFSENFLIIFLMLYLVMVVEEFFCMDHLNVEKLL